MTTTLPDLDGCGAVDTTFSESRSPKPIHRPRPPATAGPTSLSDTGLKMRDGWDLCPQTSTDSIGTERIIRRFTFRDSLSNRPIAKRLPQISHFDVRVDKDEMNATVSSTERGNHLYPVGVVPSKRDYLRVYYSDFLGQAPPEDAQRPRFADSDELTIESEELQKWVLQSSPRSRTEVYPLYLLTKDILRRVAADKCMVINYTMIRLREQLQALQEAKAKVEAEAASERESMKRTIAGLEAALEEEQKKGCGTSEDIERLAQLEAAQAGLQADIEAARKTAAKGEEMTMKARKEVEKYKKECTQATKAKQEAEMKLKKATALITSLQSNADHDPLDTMSDEHKCVSIKRLLTDDAIFKTASFTNAVCSALEAKGARGCPIATKRTICSKLLRLLCDAEAHMDGGTSALALVCRMLSTQDKPVTTYDLMRECVTRELILAPAAEQTDFLTFLADHWLGGFASAREALQDMTMRFARACLDLPEEGQGGEALADDQVLSRVQVDTGLQAFDIKDSPERFLRCAAPARWLTNSIQSFLKPRQDQAIALRSEQREDEAAALEDKFVITVGDIRRALQPASAYHALLEQDSRRIALRHIMRSFLDKELGGCGVGQALASKFTGKQEYDKHLGYPDLLATLADLLAVQRYDLVCHLTHLQSGEAMALSLADSKEAGKQRRLMLRYATALVARDKIAFYAWRGEVDISKQERDAEKTAKAAEDARQKKMKKPGTRNMSMYEGGKPTAVKTLGTQIAAIYEGKVVADELMDKQGRTREALPDFLKSFFIRQYGLKSIALKNLQNLAAGVRKEADNNPRLRLFGQLSGILHAEDYQDGKGDMMMEALKALFPTDQIKERLEGSPEMPTSSLAFATLAAFTSKYYFTDEDDLVMVDGEQDLHETTKTELIALAGPETEGEDPDDRLVNIDSWMDWLLNEYSESRSNAETFFAKLYTEFDSNGDNCLDLKEFSSLVHAVDPELDEHAIMEMYNTALDCTGDGDEIAQDAFVFVAMQSHLPCFKQSSGQTPAPE